MMAAWFSASEAAAVSDFLASEGQGLGQYVDELRERNPFKAA